MRSSILLASALAMGALAVPQLLPDVNVVTETEFVYFTVTIFVTMKPTALPPCATLIRPTPQGQPSINSVKTPGVPPPAPTLKPLTSPQPPKLPSPKPTPNLLPTPSTPKLLPAPDSTPPPSPPQVLSSTHVSGKYQAYLSSGPNYQEVVLYHHNAARANHGAAPLVWDRECEANALIAARRCNFQHYVPSGVRQGQNLYVTSGDAFNVTAGITENWYKGELGAMMPWFGQPDVPDDVFQNVGHLTQLLWKGTTKVGCVSVDCGSSMIIGGRVSAMSKFTVCNYAPPGNVGNQFAQNIAAPFSLANLGGWAD